MHHARLASSPRLIRALRVLMAARRPVGTRTLMRRAHICAVNAVIAELRENGAEIVCAQRVLPDGQRRWTYQLIKAPEGWSE